MTDLYSKIVSTGSYLPQKIYTNHDIEKLVDTSHDWIVERTGIISRHIADENESSVDMAYEASCKALERSNLKNNDIDLILVATTTPERKFPSTAVLLQSLLNNNKASAFDVNAACTGFIYALDIADKYIKGGFAKNVLVVGTEKITSLIDWSDRNTCVLFGDGAGAVVLCGHDNTDEVANYGVLSTHLHSDGRQRDILYVDGGPSSTGTVGQVRMSGKEVYKHAVSKLGEVIDEALEFNGLSPSDIDWLVPHLSLIHI